MHLKTEQREVGKQNFYASVGSEFTRRDFLKGSVAAAATGGAGLGAYYFAYTKLNDPVRVGLIGTGDEGNVLIGAHTPEYAKIIAIADIRPYNVHRAFHGDAEALGARPGLMSKYGWKTEAEGRTHVTVYTDYHELLANPDIEGVIIALPLHLHAQVAIEAMKAGKHVLTEKLMAHSVHECKEMARVSKELGKLLATGHQRHYSILYDNATDMIKQGLIGDIHHIRAQWHREKDTWLADLPGDKLKKDLEDFRKKLGDAKGPRFDEVTRKIQAIEAKLLDAGLDDSFAASHGYQENKVTDASGKVIYTCSPLEELIRWRLWNRTGGGLMAELGSHQLDASSIFVSAEWARYEIAKAKAENRAPDPNRLKVKVMPLSVTGVGGRHLYEPNRDCEDHVYCSFEFPGPGYYEDYEKLTEADTNKRIVVTYSSINGNGFGGYGEVVMGTGGTLILERETDVMTFKGSDLSGKVEVTKSKSGGPALATHESGAPSQAVTDGKAALGGPVSRGYTEEIEHWAWCIRNPGDPEKPNLPRCHPKVAMADAIIAHVSNMAMRQQKRIEFKPSWFDIDSDETPEEIAPNTSKYA